MKLFSEHLLSFIPPEDITSARDDVSRFLETPTGRAIRAGLEAGLRAEIAQSREFIPSIYAPQAQIESAIAEGRIQVLETLLDGFLGLGGKSRK